MSQNEFVQVEHYENKNEVRNVTIVLSVLTVVELLLGFAMMRMEHGSAAVLATKITIIVLMMAKAYYIVGYFMHLKHEVTFFKNIIIIPFAFIPVELARMKFCDEIESKGEFCNILFITRIG